jgi:PKD repeat protein
VAQYDWNFGDGTPITTCHVPPQGGDNAACTGSSTSNRTISHIFAATGSYTVNLTVTDSAGRKGSTSTIVPVASPNPVARLTLIKAGGNSISADGSTSTATGSASIVTYAFNWGDGSGSTVGSSPIVPHSFPAPGTYTVSLTVTDNRVPALSAVTSQSITVP